MRYNMDESSVKNKVLQEIIDLMENKMTDGLKGKSPKFMKMEVSSDPEDMNEDQSKEMTKPDIAEDLSEGEDPMSETDDLERLKELYSQLK